MAKKKPAAAPTPKAPRPSGTWPVALAVAAAGRTDDGVGLQHLIEEAGFSQKPAMSIIVKRPRPAKSERGRIVDPYVDDVLDALRALCG